jgi:hypothetical protein
VQGRRRKEGRKEGRRDEESAAHDTHTVSERMNVKASRM